MPAGLGITFRFVVARDGYRWVDERDGQRPIDDGTNPIRLRDVSPPWLIPVFGPERISDVRVEQSHSRAAYSAFAKLSRRLGRDQNDFKEAVVAFANRYGPLGRGVQLEQRIEAGFIIQCDPWIRGERWVDGERGESLGRWAREVQDFADLFNLVQLFKKGDVDQVSERIKWDAENHSVSYRHLGRRFHSKPIASEDRFPWTYNSLLRRRDYDVAWFYLSENLNKALAGCLSARIPARPSAQATFEPRTLLDALYLRMYLDVAEIEPVRACEACGKPLPPNATARRRFCGSTCRGRGGRRKDRLAGEASEDPTAAEQ